MGLQPFFWPSVPVFFGTQLTGASDGEPPEMARKRQALPDHWRSSFGHGSWSRSSIWRRPRRHHRLTQKAGVEAAGWRLHAAGQGVRPVQFGDHWFIRRSVGLRQNRHPIAATRARRDLAVGEKLFARMQACLFASPENLSSAPIREINQPRMVHFNHFGALVSQSLHSAQPQLASCAAASRNSSADITPPGTTE